MSSFSRCYNTNRPHSSLSLIGHCLLTCALLLALTLPFAKTIQAQEKGPEKKTVIFLPFKVSVPGSYDYLKNGLSSVLASRLSAKADIIAVAQNSKTEKMAEHLFAGQHDALRKMLKNAKADYLIIGSLEKNDSGYEIISYLFSNGTGAVAREFSQKLSSIDDALTAMDALSWDIAASAFGVNKPEIAQTQSSTDGMDAFRTAHPEKAFREGSFHSAELGGLSGAFTLASTQRSRKIAEDIKDINAADLDGDGLTEIAMVSNTALFIYQVQEGNFRKLSTLPLDSHLRVHAVTMADIDGDGVKEILISGSNGNLPSSSIFKWNGKTATIVTKAIPYYLRAEKIKGKAVLYGQQPEYKKPIGGSIYTLKPTGPGTFTRINKLALPSGTNLFDFIQADIDGNGTEELVQLNDKNRLQVLDLSGNLLWTSGTQYGESRNFLGTLASRDSAAIERPSIHTRLIASDLDQDGAMEIIVGKNRETSVRFMSRLTYFEGSSITALSWKDNSFTPLWETTKIPSYTVNYQIYPSSQKNVFELIFLEAESSYPFEFWSGSSGTINRYTINRNE